jgi:hypothetical protein
MLYNIRSKIILKDAPLPHMVADVAEAPEPEDNDGLDDQELGKGTRL